MGGEKDGRVVNGIGEVYGVKNLMVADASIIPYHMDGNTSGPVLFNRLRSGREMNEILTKHILWRIKNIFKISPVHWILSHLQG